MSEQEQREAEYEAKIQALDGAIIDAVCRLAWPTAFDDPQRRHMRVMVAHNDGMWSPAYHEMERLVATLRAERDAALAREKVLREALESARGWFGDAVLGIEKQSYIEMLEFTSNALRAALAASPGEAVAVAAERADAMRWRKLVGCERIRLLGSARLGAPDAHIGLELWGTFPPVNDIEGVHTSSRDALLAFVDGLSIYALPATSEGV